MLLCLDQLFRKLSHLDTGWPFFEFLLVSWPGHKISMVEVADSRFLSCPLTIVASDTLLEVNWLLQGEEDLRRLTQRHIVQDTTQQVNISSAPTNAAAHTQTGSVAKGLPEVGRDGVVGIVDAPVSTALGVGMLLKARTALDVGVGTVVTLMIAGSVRFGTTPVTGGELDV